MMKVLQELLLATADPEIGARAPWDPPEYFYVLVPLSCVVEVWC